LEKCNYRLKLCVKDGAGLMENTSRITHNKEAIWGASVVKLMFWIERYDTTEKRTKR